MIAKPNHIANALMGDSTCLGIRTTIEQQYIVKNAQGASPGWMYSISNQEGILNTWATSDKVTCCYKVEH